MMATTHGLAGLLLGAVLALAAPEFATTAMLAGFLGGIAPDFDLYTGHRRTFHFPVYAALVAGPALLLAVLVPTMATVAVAALLVGAAAHAAMDALGGGLELRPWEGDSERAVYSHYHGRWLRPRRWVPYDGSPRDLALAVGLAVPALSLTTGHLQAVVAATVAISAGYTLARRHLARLAALVAASLPAALSPYVPERYRGNNRRTNVARRR